MVMQFVVDFAAIPWKEAPAPLPRCGKVLQDGLKNPEIAPLSVGIFKFKPTQYGLPHTHDKEVEIFFTTSGTGTLVIDGNNYELKVGTIAFVPPGHEHHPVNNGESDWEYLAIFSTAFDMSFVETWV